MSSTIGELIEWSAINYPNKTGLIYREKEQSFTFQELNEKVNQFASSLSQLGVKKGDVVSTFLYNTSEFVITLFASAKLGAIFNPINYRLTPNELQYILNDAGSKVLIFEKDTANVVEETTNLGVNVSHCIYTDEYVPQYAMDFYKLLETGYSSKPDVTVTEDDIYIMMYTSGTTGRPKGVIHKHRDMVHHNFLMIECMKLSKNDVGLSVAPLNHTAELHTSFLPRVMVGATTIIKHHFEAEKVLKTIEEEKITHIFAAPTMVNMLLNVKEFENYDLSTLRILGYGGASMAPVLIRRFQEKTNADLVQMFGTTEMGPVMSVLYADEQLERAGSAGKAILTHQMKIARVQEDGGPTNPSDECDIGEIGEILVKGPCMMKEYYRRPEATEKALAYGWYHTGDMGYVDKDGYVWIKDRMDYMINSGAENVYPREVEDSIQEHHDVLEVAVIGKSDPYWGETVVAFVVKREGSLITEKDLDQFLIDGKKLAKYKRPREYHFVESLPKTTSGKLQKFVLAKELSKEEGGVK
ncbi:long-chain-fatty-acid--CoA ligase [Bacillus sp. FJAT-49705]|uniref:Long-chain-fatty-acid--CoA ligase n=1 Tax=Cytobacillus citreus TaxID=2833586 RepID=A0ABS5NX06_9BACI|nr:long-chain-fatty-acid--CoA ligase [Cytobacillus citreus]MBS4191673.1 long-chain-fatty-acid--CoA ligase [Cytobacillus citreus]